ncbi:MAG: PspC domain-containing protein [Pseudomonadota bacterium]|mgnify:CR=1 FL=1
MRHDYRRYLSGLYLDRENGWLFGVAAGLADRFAIDVSVVRILFALGFIFFTLLTAVAYGLAAALLSDRPLAPTDPERERDFWRSPRSY